MAFSMFRPFREMPKLKLSTEMFLKLDPFQSYLTFSNDDPNDPTSVDLMNAFLHFPGAGKVEVASDVINLTNLHVSNETQYEKKH